MDRSNIEAAVAKHLDVGCSKDDSVREQLNEVMYSKCPVDAPVPEIRTFVFHGIIKSLAVNYGMIEFQIGNRKEVAVFYKNKILVNKVKLTPHTSLLTVLQVGMPVSIMVDHYKEKKYCNFIATAVEVEVLEGLIINESPIVDHTPLEESPKNVHETTVLEVYNTQLINEDTILNLDSPQTSGTNIALSPALEDVQQTSALGVYNTDMPCSNSLLGILPIPIRGNYCIIGKVKDCLSSNEVDNGYNTGSSSIEGAVVELPEGSIGCTQAESVQEKPHEVMYSDKVWRVLEDPPIPEIKNGAIPNSDAVTSPQESWDVSGKVFRGTIIRMTHTSGIIAFHINNDQEKAIFKKKKIFINKVKISSRTSLLTELQLGMSVSLMVKRCTGNNSFNFMATLVEAEVLGGYITKHCTVESSTSLQESSVISNREFYGTIQSLTEKWGMIVFHINNKEEKAICYRKIFIKEIKVSDHTSLLTLFKVGMLVSLMVDDYIGFQNCSFVATDLKVVELQGPLTMFHETESAMNENVLKTPANSLLSTLLNLPIRGYTGKVKSYTSSSTGIVECSVYGHIMAAPFTREFVISDDNDESVSLQKLLPIGKTIYFNGVIKEFQGYYKLRITCMWHDKKRQLSCREFGKINFGTLQNNQEYSGTVCEIRPPHAFVATVGNIPVLIDKRYYYSSKRSKMRTFINSIAFGDTVRMVVQRKYGKKAEYDWVAVDAWGKNDRKFSGSAKLRGNVEVKRKCSSIASKLPDDVKCSTAASLLVGGISAPTEPHDKVKTERKCSSAGSLMAERISGLAKLRDEMKCSTAGSVEGKLVMVEETVGVSADSFHGRTASFQHADAFMLNVPFADMDLTWFLTQGDMLSYTLPTQLQAAQVQFGTQESEDVTQRFGEIITYGNTRSLDTSVSNAVSRRPGNQQIVSKEETTHLVETDGVIGDQLYGGFNSLGFDVFRGLCPQTHPRNIVSRESNVLGKKVTEPTLITENSHTPPEQLLGGLPPKTPVRASHSSSSQDIVEANKHLGNEIAQVESFNALKQQLDQYRILPEVLKQALECLFLSIIYRQSNNKIYSEEMEAETQVIIKNSIKDFLTGPLLEKILQLVQVPDAMSGNIQSRGTVESIEVSAVELTEAHQSVQVPCGATILWLQDGHPTLSHQY